MTRTVLWQPLGPLHLFRSNRTRAGIPEAQTRCHLLRGQLSRRIHYGPKWIALAARPGLVSVIDAPQLVLDPRFVHADIQTRTTSPKMYRIHKMRDQSG